MIDSLDVLNTSTMSEEDAVQHYGVMGMKWGIRRYQKELAWKKRNSAMANVAADKRTGKISKEEAKSRRHVIKGELKSDLAKNKAYVKSLKGSDKSEVKKIYDTTKEKATREIPYNRLKKASRALTNIPAGISAFHAAAAGTTLAAIGAATANPVLLGVGLADIALTTPMTVITNRIQRGIQKRMYY